MHLEQTRPGDAKHKINLLWPHMGALEINWALYATEPSSIFIQATNTQIAKCVDFPASLQWLRAKNNPRENLSQ